MISVSVGDEVNACFPWQTLGRIKGDVGYIGIAKKGKTSTVSFVSWRWETCEKRRIVIVKLEWKNASIIMPSSDRLVVVPKKGTSCPFERNSQGAESDLWSNSIRLGGIITGLTWLMRRSPAKGRSFGKPKRFSA